MAKPDRKPDPDAEPNYDMADPDYDDTVQASFEDVADPDYDESRQVEYSEEVADADAEEGSQEWRTRPQK